MLKLIPDWRNVLAKAWSIRMILLAGLFSALEVALPLVEFFLPVPQGIFAILSIVTTFAAVIARILAQNNLPQPAAPVIDSFEETL